MSRIHPLRVTVCGALCCAWVCFTGSARNANAQDRFAILGMVNPTTTGVLTITSNGKVANTIAAFPTGTVPLMAAPAGDNETFYVVSHTFRNPALHTLWQTRATGGLRQLLQVAVSVSWIVPDGAGGLYVGLSRPGSSIVVQINGTASVGSATLPAGFAPDAIGMDPANGQLFFRTPQNGSYLYGHLDPKTGTTQTFPSQANGLFSATRQLVYDRRNGGSFVEALQSTTGAASLFLVARGGPIAVFAQGPAFGYVRAIARAGDRSWPIVYHGLSLVPGHDPRIFRVDTNGRASPPYRIHASVLSWSPMLRVGGAALTERLVNQPNDRDLRIRLPVEAGRRYAIALSASGPGPGPRLADGREVPLTLDAFVPVSLAGIPGVLRGCVGTLDAQGEGVIEIRANRFARSVAGATLWAAGVVFDPAASAGVAEVVGPARVSLR